MILLSLALRNVLKTLGRRVFVAATIAVTLAILFVGNTLFLATEDGLQSTYRNSFTGELSVSEHSDTTFTLFGNELEVVGDYEVLPVLADPKLVETSLAKTTAVEEIAHQVTTAALVQIDGHQRASVVFGVDFDEYFRFFSSLVLRDGNIPAPGRHAILLNTQALKDLETKLRRHLKIGQSLQLVSSNAGGFTIREVEYAGSFQYPVSDALLSRIVLTDADTARALAGYVYGGTRAVETDSSQTNLLGNTDDLDKMFSGTADTSFKAQDGVTLDAVDQALKARDTSQDVTLDGAWNFVLVRLKSGSNIDWEAGRIRADLGKSGSETQVRDWRSTAGGNAQLVYFLRMLFNIGMIAVVLIAGFVTTNALALNVYERTREIGTMRAMGATQQFVAWLLVLETVILVAGAGAVGLAFGVFGVEVLNMVGVPITNPLLAAMFGAELVHPPVMWGLLVIHFVLAIVVAALALILPVRIALRVAPVRAMAQEN